MIELLLLFSFFNRLQEAPQWCLVFRDGTVEAGWGALPAPAPPGADHAWVWSMTQPPSRLEPRSFHANRRLVAGPALTVTIVGQNRPRAAGGASSDFEVIAAPEEMWNEIPEHLLPRWPTGRSTALEVPRGRGQNVRLRLVGDNMGSWWVSAPAKQRRVVIPVRPALTTMLRVLEPGDVPAANALAVAFESGPLNSANKLARIGTDRGEIRLRSLPDDKQLFLMITQGGFPPVGLRARPSALPAIVRLSPGAILAGRVADPEGKALALASVSAEVWMAGLPRVFRVRGESEVEGHWRLAGLPVGRAVLRVERQGYAPLDKQIDLKSGFNEAGVLTLVRGAAMTVAVRGSQGALLEEASVSAGVVSPPVRTNQAGEARLTHLPEKPLELLVTAPGHLKYARLLQPPFERRTEVVLRAGFEVKGRVVGSQGSSLADGAYRVTQGSRFERHSLAEDGTFRVLLEPGQGAQLVFTSRQHLELSLPVSAGQPGEVRELGDLELPTGSGLRGRVVDSATGGGVPAARVWLPRPGNQGSAVASATGDILEAVTSWEGSFLVSGVRPGAATVRVEAPGFARKDLDVMVSDGGETEMGEIVLSLGTTVHVDIDAAHDLPANAVARADPRGQWLEQDLLTATVERGEATIHDVPPGRILVSVVADRNVICETTVNIPEGTAETAVLCQVEQSEVRGRVTVGGRPSDAGTLVWLPAVVEPALIQTTTSPGGLECQTIVGAGRPQIDVIVQADGTFRSRGIPPGEWEVHLVGQAAVFGDGLSIAVPETPLFDVALDFPGLSLGGRVVDADELPVEGARVEESYSKAFTSTAADGSFSLLGVREGPVVVQARSGSRVSAPEQFLMSADRVQRELLLVISQPEPELRLRAVDLDGAPVAGALVFFESSSGDHFLVTGAADGIASVALPTPEPERCRWAVLAAGAWSFGDWISVDAALKAGVSDVTIGPTGSLMLERANDGGPLTITAPSGWDLSLLLARLGQPIPSTAGSHVISGLAEGGYEIATGRGSIRLQVRAGQVLTAHLP
jgi:Carboxypeptidase regulatory-like domain